MQDAPARTGGTRRRPCRAPLSEIHAEALWLPRPPVGYDDDGYPFEDQTLSESTAHDDVLNYFRNAAFALLADRPDAMVQQNLLILFEEGNRAAAVEPDVTVALGVGRHPRNSYKVWVEGRPPDLVVEGLSEKTWRRDVDIKPALYRDLGVREFWQVDPLGRLPAPITGYRLRGGVYERIAPSCPGVYRSDVLEAGISYDRTEMAILDPRTGERIPLVHDALRQRDDAVREREDALRQRLEERKAHEAALVRIAELESRLKRSN
ncbi:MAG: Uma2 family endonuclease [Gammaproteobacteria bacterium]|nr:Uma2 family endonuclease [Gammaproteobacteria bacterium]